MLIPEIDIAALPGPDDIIRVSLPNGITILARHNPHSPAVVVRGYLRCGGMQETHENAGLSMLTASALRLGTERHRHREIDELIENIGGHLAIGPGKSRTTFFGKSLADDLKSILAILAEVIQSPTFPEKEFQRLRARHLTGLKERDQDTFAMALQGFSKLLYGDHPYGIALDGYRQSVERLTASDCREFHAAQYHPQDMVVIVVGGVEPRQAIGMVRDAFEGWLPGPAPKPSELPEWRFPASGGRRHVSLHDRSQCDVIIGVAGPGRSQDDYLPSFMANQILGQYGLSGRLGRSLREEAGLAYYVSSSLLAGKGRPPWLVSTGIAPQDTEKAIELILAELNKLVTQPVSEEELMETKAYLIGGLPLSVESNEGVADALQDMVYFDLGLDHLHQAPDLIAELTRDQVLEAAQRYIKLGSIVTAVAGPIPAWKA
jgi:zinc protease